MLLAARAIESLADGLAECSGWLLPGERDEFMAHIRAATAMVQQRLVPAPGWRNYLLDAAVDAVRAMMRSDGA